MKQALQTKLKRQENDKYGKISNLRNLKKNVEEKGRYFKVDISILGHLI